MSAFTYVDLFGAEGTPTALKWPKPAPSPARCVMGGPLGDDHWCWAPAVRGELFCALCAGDGGCDCPGCVRPFPPIEGDAA